MRPERVSFADTHLTTHSTLSLDTSYLLSTSSSNNDGCRDEPPPAGIHNVTLSVPDTYSDAKINRTHLVYVPTSYTGTQKVPIHLLFHGSHSDPMELLENDLFQSSEENGYILVAPSGGTKYMDKGYAFTVPFVPPIDPNTYPNPLEDVTYTLRVLKHTLRNLCTNKRRVYASGHSGGARFASALACDPTFSNHLAAIGAVSGLRAGPPTEDLAGPVTQGYKSCRPAKALGLVAFHSENDTVDPYEGNTNPQWGYGVPQALQRWRSILGRTDQSVSERYLTGTDRPVRRRAVDYCGGGGMIEYYVENHSHDWPIDVQGLDVNQKLWDQLSRYSSSPQ